MLTERQKEISRKAGAKWREKNREYERQRRHEYYLTHKEEDTAKNKRWIEANPERIKEVRQASYHRNKNKDIPSNRKEYKMLTAAKKRATKSNLPFDLELSDIIIPELCPVLGIPITYNPVGNEHKWQSDNSPSLDKLIPELGYIKGNVKVISWRANQIKSFGTAEEHRKIADYIDSHTG